jgi:hypothetical protein
LKQNKHSPTLHCFVGVQFAGYEGQLFIIHKLVARHVAAEVAPI